MAVVHRIYLVLGMSNTLIRASENTEVDLRRYKVVRGALDFGGVVGRTQSRSKYGGKTLIDFFVGSELILAIS